MRVTRTYLPIAVLLSGLLTSCASTPHQESTGQYLDNTVITSRVKTGLLADPLVKGLGITVTSFKGNVELAGNIDSERERKRALSIAWSVPGVTNVEDHLALVHRHHRRHK